MSYFTLGWLREGMIVLRTVSNSKGQILVKAGAVLSMQDLSRLEQEGVKGLEVQAPAQAATALPRHLGSGPETPERFELRLQQRFRHLDPAQPLVKELLRLCRMRETLPQTEPNGHDR